MKVVVTQRGSWKKTHDFLDRMKRRTHLQSLAKFGPRGVAALRAATPIDEGETRDGWYYEIAQRPGYFAVHWLNSNVVNPGAIPVAVLIQYGHATGNGAYVEGRDYINPALRSIFDEMAAEMWREVTK